jgi:hypothetical protein
LTLMRMTLLRTGVFTHTYKHALSQSCMHVRMHICTCMRERACMCIYAYVLHMHMHMHMQRITNFGRINGLICK